MAVARRRIPIWLPRSAAGLALVAAVTGLCYSLIPVNASTAGFAFLIVILAIAASWGLIESVIASVAAMVCLNFFFLPPILHFTIADPQNWIALFTFLATALVASHLSSRAQQQAQEARNRQREMEQLYALSRAILLTAPTEPVGLNAARQIAQIFELPAVTLFDAKSGTFFPGGPEDAPEFEAMLRQVAMQGGPARGGSPDEYVVPVTLGGDPIGALALRGVNLSDGALQAICNLVAIALERVHTIALSSRAEVARQSEEFKSTLLDAIAHEFKTPLTSVKAAATSLVADPAAGVAHVQELASIINEETDRLSQLVTEALRMSQIDAGKVKIERRSVSVEDLVERVLRHFAAQLGGRQVNVDVPEPLLRISADRDLLILALRQLVDNGLKYSPPDKPLEVRTECCGEHVNIHVRDYGPGIPERDRDRVFEKFYRGDKLFPRQITGSDAPGTGMGLYIAREIVRAHGGAIWVESAHGGGSDFCVALPVEEGHQPQ